MRIRDYWLAIVVAAVITALAGFALHSQQKQTQQIVETYCR